MQVTTTRSPHRVPRTSAIAGCMVSADSAPRMRFFRGWQPRKFTDCVPSASIASNAEICLRCNRSRNRASSVWPSPVAVESAAKAGAEGAGRSFGMSSDAHAASRQPVSVGRQTPRRGDSSLSAAGPPPTTQVTTRASPTRVVVMSDAFDALPLAGVIEASSPARSAAPRKVIDCIAGSSSGSSFAASRASTASSTPRSSEAPSVSSERWSVGKVGGAVAVGAVAAAAAGASSMARVVANSVERSSGCMGCSRRGAERYRAEAPSVSR